MVCAKPEVQGRAGLFQRTDSSSVFPCNAKLAPDYSAFRRGGDALRRRLVFPGTMHGESILLRRSITLHDPHAPEVVPKAELREHSGLLLKRHETLVESLCCLVAPLPDV